MTDKQNEKIKQLKPFVKNLDLLFKRMLIEFNSGEFYTRTTLPTFGGVYAFYDKGSPIYVGRANNIKKRVMAHTRESSSHYSANFAFNLARLEFEEKVSETRVGREILAKEKGFVKIFSKYKKQLNVSQIRCLEIPNDIVQTMFEPYLAFKLGTYPDNNIFENH